MTDAADIAARVRSLLRDPDVDVERRDPRGIGAALRRATSGRPRQTDLLVRAADSGGGGRGGRGVAFVVEVPNDEPVVAEHIAGTIDIALGVRRRFGPAIAHLRAIRFDHSSSELRSGAHHGEAYGHLSTVSMTADLVTVRGYDALRPRVGDVEAWVRRVTAHELWHLMHAWMTARRPQDEASMQRALGLHFGSDNLSHVTHQRGAPRDRLVAEVSAYAATNPLEAMAELFEQWWCRPPEQFSPAVRLFGELVERYLPPPDGSRG